MSKEGRRVRDKWRAKNWYSVYSPPYFGGVEVGSTPSRSGEEVVGRTVETTLHEITGDFSQQYLKLHFQITETKANRADTIFKGHEYSRDYLRSLVRRGSTRIDGEFVVDTKDGYRLRVAIVAFTAVRVKKSQQDGIRAIMAKIAEDKAKDLTFDQYVHEAVLGKIASDIYNEAKKIAPLRHVGVRKSKLLSAPSPSPTAEETPQTVAAA